MTMTVISADSSSGASTKPTSSDRLNAMNRMTPIAATAATAAVRNEPTIDWLLANQDEVQHYFHELGVKGEL